MTYCQGVLQVSAGTVARLNLDTDNIQRKIISNKLYILATSLSMSRYCMAVYHSGHQLNLVMELEWV